MKIDNKAKAESVYLRVSESVNILATGKGDVRERLKSAFYTFRPLNVKEFPEELQDDYKWIISQMTKFKSENHEFEGNMEATMRRIRKSTGQKIAERFMKIFWRIEDYQRGYAQ